MSTQESFAFIRGLALGEPSARLSGLRQEHDRLLSSVARKRKELQSAVEEARQTATLVASRLSPLVEEAQRLDAEIHGLFAELLAPRRLGKRDRAQVARLYQELQQGEVLSRRREGAVDQPGGAFNAAPAPAADDAGDAPAPPRGPAISEAASGAVRGVFLRLARVLHPDRVQDDVEKALRTESMKEITRAYEAGDLARLVELERTLQEGRGHAITGGVANDVDGQCESLERTNRALREQLEALRGDLRALRRSPPGRMAEELKRMRRGTGADPIAELTAEAEADMPRFRQLRDFVQAFRDGKISLREFLEGPPDEAHDGDEDLELDDLLEVIATMAEAVAGESPRRRRRRRGRKRRS